MHDQPAGARRELETSVFLWGDRHFPPAMVAEGARALAASGAVDYISQSTQLGSFVPRQLWTAENAPMAKIMSDPDSLHDAWLMTGCAHAAAPSLGLSVLTDSIRIGPAQLTQMALTLAHMTEGRAIVHIGAGEMKNAAPFGWKRSRDWRGSKTSAASSKHSGSRTSPSTSRATTGI